jgi:hypothetical protein
MVERFNKEIELASHIHKNVYRIYDLDEIRGNKSIRIQNIKRQDLKNLIQRAGKLMAEENNAILKQIR